MKIRYLLPSSITAAALIAGLFSILKSISGDYMMSAQFIMLAMILDGLDGNVSRWIKASSDFGAELDTFVDITAFGVAPAVLTYQVLFNKLGAFGLVFVSLMLLSGALRLARFKIIDPARGNYGYTGLPITVNACWVAMAVFLNESSVLDEKFFNLTSGWGAVTVWAGSLALILLQVSRIHYAKPTKGVLSFAFCAFAVALLFLRAHVAVAAAFGMMVCTFVYAFVTPFLPKHALVIESDEEEEETPDFTHLL